MSSPCPVTPTPTEDSCPRHSPVASAGFGIKLNRNPPAGNGCRRCRREEAKKDAIEYLWHLLACAEIDPTYETMNDTVEAINNFMEIYAEVDNLDTRFHAVGRITAHLKELSAKTGIELGC